MKIRLIITCIFILTSISFAQEIETYISGANKTFTQATPVNATFTGTISYKDNNNNLHPIRYCLMHLIDNYTKNIIDSTYTNANGQYSITVNNNSHEVFFVKIIAKGKYILESKHICICYDSLGSQRLVLSNIDSCNIGQPSISFSYTVASNIVEQGAFSVYDAIVEAFILVRQKLPTAILYKTKIFTPSYTTALVGLNIHIQKVYGFVRDAIIHEYGHRIPQMNGQFAGGSDGGNSTHSPYKNLTVWPVIRTTQQARYLAFREAWATFFSVAIQYDSTSNPDTDFDMLAKQIQPNGDTIWIPYSYSMEEIEQSKIGADSGEYYTSAHTGVFWDAFDNNNHAINDSSKDFMNVPWNDIWAGFTGRRKQNADGGVTQDMRDFWDEWVFPPSLPQMRFLEKLFPVHHMQVVTNPCTPPPEFVLKKIEELRKQNQKGKK